MITDPALSFVMSLDGLDFYEFKVGLFKYYHTPMADYEKLFSRKIRETLDYVRGGYRVFYVSSSDTLIGRITVTKGGCRNRFCTAKDLVLTSLWVQPEARGRGYSKIICKGVSDIVRPSSGLLYAYIRHDNEPSKRACISVGFEMIGSAKYKGALRSIVPDDHGPLGIYKKQYQL